MAQVHGPWAPKLGSIFLSRKAKSAPRRLCGILSLITDWDSNSQPCQSKTRRISPPCLPGSAPSLAPAPSPNRSFRPRGTAIPGCALSRLRLAVPPLHHPSFRAEQAEFFFPLTLVRDRPAKREISLLFRRLIPTPAQLVPRMDRLSATPTSSSPGLRVCRGWPKRSEWPTGGTLRLCLPKRKPKRSRPSRREWRARRWRP